MSEELQTQSPDVEVPEGSNPEVRKRKNPFAKFKRAGGNGKKKWKKWVALLLVLAVIASVVVWKKSKSKDTTQQTYTEEAVSYQDIKDSLSASGTLEPANSYTVTTLSGGEVQSADFEEGDTVTKDTVLYTIDSSDASSSLEKAQISLNEAQQSYDDAVDAAYVKAPVAGTVASLNVSVGDSVTAGETIATVRDASVMTLKVPFDSSDTAGFYVGEGATVTLDGSFETLSGTVKSISGADTVLTGNRIVRYVTIQVKNDGGLTDTQVATASVAGSNSSDSATMEYKAQGTVTASTSGTVSAINVNEGGTVSKDQKIVTLSGDALDQSIQKADDSLRNAQLSMENVQDQLDNYTITSPIDGTIVDKETKVGDNVESGDTLCTIYDLSYLQMTMSIDELDISQVAVGQTVSITADAVEGKTYTGTVTKVSVAGTTSNGTTTYPVTVQIDDTDGLLPGMNVDAEIVIQESDNALAVPVAAVSRGNKVLITSDSPSASNATDETAPDGYVYVKVTTGISDDDYIEITDGLQEGDTVAYVEATSSSSSSNQQQSMFGGGQMSGGGQISGGGGNFQGGGGGAPSGGGPQG